MADPKNSERSVDARYIISTQLRKAIDQNTANKANDDGVFSVEELKRDETSIDGFGALRKLTKSGLATDKVTEFMKEHGMVNISPDRLADAIAGVSGVSKLSSTINFGSINLDANALVTAMETQLLSAEERQKKDPLFKDDVKYMPLSPQELPAKSSSPQK